MKKSNALTSTVIPLHKSVAISLLHLEKVAAGRMRWRGTEGEAKALSQTGHNSPWSSNAVSIEAKGVNHAEMLDNDKIRIIMNGIFDRTTPGVDPFFKTDPK
jgi:hypothetical protein